MKLTIYELLEFKDRAIAMLIDDYNELVKYVSSDMLRRIRTISQRRHLTLIKD